MTVRDEVCGMTITAEQAAANVEFEGKVYYFCSDRCRLMFQEHPDWYVPTRQNASGRDDLGARD